MKKILIFLFCLQSNAGYSQSIPPAADSAEKYLSGVFVKYNPEKAFTLFMQRAQSGDPRAMNAIGMLYTKGMGVDSNFNEALNWFKASAASGYTKAWVNMGMLYKHRALDSSDYATANRYFDTALINNEPSAHFAKGYMLYKGLGCTQDYAEALTQFRLGSALNRADCLYFMGLCFKYGYGVQANGDSATFYIDQSALLGYKPANAERYYNLPGSDTGYVSRTSRARRFGVVEITPRIPLQRADTLKRITPSDRHIELDGNYTGMMLQYDFSGKQIISEVPVKVFIKAMGSRVTGTWQQGNKEPVKISAIQEGSRLLFSDQFFLTAVIKGRKKSFPVIFRSAELEAQVNTDSVVLFGTIQMFNTFSREPEKPINVRLVKLNKAGLPEAIPKNVTVFPNPVTGNGISVRLNLDEESPVTINIYDINGRKVYSVIHSHLKWGLNTITIYPNELIAGFYILQFRQGRKTESVTFINK